MNLENHPACRTANKVAMLMRYAASIPESNSSDSVIDEALLLTLEIFQLCNLETIFETFATHCERLDRVREATRSSPQNDRWTAEACDLLRSMGFHEKLITVLGDKLHRWQSDFVASSMCTQSAFAQSLTQLANECSETTRSNLTELAADARTATQQSDMDRFSQAVCGLAIVLASSTQRDSSADVEPASGLPTLEALSCFGGHLVTKRAT